MTKNAQKNGEKQKAGRRVRRIRMRAGSGTPAARKLIRLSCSHKDNRASTLEDLLRARRVPAQEEAVISAFSHAAADFCSRLEKKQAAFLRTGSPVHQDVEDMIGALETYARSAEALREKAVRAQSAPCRRRRLPEKACRRGKTSRAPHPRRIDVSIPRDSPIGRKVEEIADGLRISPAACLRLLLLHRSGIFTAPHEKVLEMFCVYEKSWALLHRLSGACMAAGCIESADNRRIRRQQEIICAVAADIKAGRLLKCS